MAYQASSSGRSTSGTWPKASRPPGPSGAGGLRWHSSTAAVSTGSVRPSPVMPQPLTKSWP